MGLSSRNCVPCKGGVAPLSYTEAERFLPEVPDWVLKEGPTRIERNFQFKDFVTALAFANQVGELAEAEGHHPDIKLGWGYCTLSFYTHKINGLHENDFIMAYKVNHLNSPQTS